MRTIHRQRQSMYDTFLASAFRSIRFGVNEAHGRGIAIQLNNLLDHGAFRISPDGTFAVNPARIKDGVIALTRELLTLRGTFELRMLSTEQRVSV